MQPSKKVAAHWDEPGLTRSRRLTDGPKMALAGHADGGPAGPTVGAPAEHRRAACEVPDDHATPTATPHSRTRLLPLAVGASVAQMLMLIPGYSDAGSFQIGGVGQRAGGLAGAQPAALPGRRAGRGPVTGIVLGVLSLVSVLVFWAGVDAAAGRRGGRRIAWTGFSGRQDCEGPHRPVPGGAQTFAVVAIIIAAAVTN